MISQQFRPYTIDELCTLIYEDNLDHFNNSSDDCDCYIHITIKTIVNYWEGS